jgi:hypothetical protein
MCAVYYLLLLVCSECFQLGCGNISMHVLLCLQGLVVLPDIGVVDAAPVDMAPLLELQVRLLGQEPLLSSGSLCTGAGVNLSTVRMLLCSRLGLCFLQ